MPIEKALVARVRARNKAAGTRKLRRRLLEAEHSVHPQGGYVVTVPGIGPVVLTEDGHGLTLRIALISPGDAHRAMGALEHFLDPEDRNEVFITWDN